jgi:HEAT repeat protein
VRANLRRIEFIPWIVANLSVLDALREQEQPGVVHLAVCSSAPRQHVLEVVAYVLLHGKVVGRRVAAEALAEFNGPTADELTLKLMDDDDSKVRAAAARQLRVRNLPGATQRLLELLDSDHDGEREAARAGLVEFSWERFSANFDALTPEARASSGALVCRVDPQAVDNVRAELDAPTRSRRKRALEMAVAMGAIAKLQPQIVSLLKDEDQFLRIDAINTLAQLDNPLTRQALRDALLDSNALVQQAAETALANLTRADQPERSALAAEVEASRETVLLTRPFSALSNTTADAAPPQPALEPLPVEVAQ